MKVNFVAVNVGPKYPMSYVSILFDSIARNASLLAEEHDIMLWCLTDRADELPEVVNPILANPTLPGWWQKVYLFSPSMPWGEGERVIYFDLDVVITGRLEELAERTGIIKDWHWPSIFNSSVMSWLHGDFSSIWTKFDHSVITRPSGPALAKLLPAGQVNGGDQEWISAVAPHWPTFPPDWFPSYRTCVDWPPNNAKAVIMHGQIKPADVTEGWVPEVWKIGGLTAIPTLKGVNVTHEHILENIRSACQRDLPWFTGFREDKRRAVIVGGAPSLKDSLADIRAHKRDGASIISVNNSWRMLMEAGIVPDNHVMLDARAENAAFLEGAPETTRYLIASQCHPDVFDALAGKDVILWHNSFGDREALKAILQPWWDEGPNQRPCIMVPGGGTVALRTLWLCAYAGFRTIHMYGVDSSYADDGSHHAYAQPINDNEAIRTVTMRGKLYQCAGWMLRQASEFRDTWEDLRAYVDIEGKARPIAIHVHGRGLLPDIAKTLRQQARAA